MDFKIHSQRRRSFETLLKIAVSTRRAISKFETIFGEEDYMAPFVRVFNERKPQYRVFLAILALSVALRVDLSARVNEPDELKRMEDFVKSARRLLENDESYFIKVYAKAFHAFAAEARLTAGSDAKIKQYLSNLLRRGFEQLYLTLRMDIDVDKKMASLD